MQGRKTPSAQELEARAAVDQASNGKLPHVAEYSLQIRKRQYRISFPPIFVDNFGTAKVDEFDVYVDFDRGMVVYSLGTSGGGEE